jgi:hypothetical protein
VVSRRRTADDSRAPASRAAIPTDLGTGRLASASDIVRGHDVSRNDNRIGTGRFDLAQHYFERREIAMYVSENRDV